MKTLLTLIAPGALTLATAGVLLLVLPENILELASSGYPLVALALATLLAWRMHRSRLMLTAILLLCAHSILHDSAFGDHPHAPALVAALLPLLIAALALSVDRNVAGRYALLQTALVAVPVALAAAVLTSAPPESLDVLTRDFIDPAYTRWTGLPQIALLAALVGVGGLIMLALLRQRSIDAGLAWATIAGMIALASSTQTAEGTTARGIWMLAAGLVIIIALVEHAYVMAYHDELTGLPARRSLAQTLAALRPPYTVAIVDVDHFKSFNDRYGHDTGDEVLRMVATKLAAVTGGGRAYRSGGEEFTIVFPGRTKAEVLPHVEQLRQAVADTRFTVRTKPRPKKTEGERRRGAKTVSERRIGVTISVGLASVDKRHATTDAVVKAADKAMYRAKQSGRNRVVA